MNYYLVWHATSSDRELWNTPEYNEVFSHGVSIDIAPGDLIKRVVVHPQGGRWLETLVRPQLEDAGVSKGVLWDGV